MEPPPAPALTCKGTATFLCPHVPTPETECPKCLQLSPQFEAWHPRSLVTGLPRSPLAGPPCSLVSCDLPVPSLAVSSAGIGRTGCFIATRIGCQQLKARGEVDILGIVCRLRLDRWVNRVEE